MPVTPEIAVLPQTPEIPVSPGVLAAPEAAVSPEVERCTQCGGALETSDIFCPVCGFVRSAAGHPRQRDTAVIEPVVVRPGTVASAIDDPREARTAEGSTGQAAVPELAVPEAVVPQAAVVEPVVPEPVVPKADVPEADVPEADVEQTRLVRRGSGVRFVLQFSTGESLSVSGTGLVGRNPLPEPGEHFDEVIAILDPGKSVSKTHLEYGQETGVFWVSDRFSGNGTVLREPDREPRRCDAGKRYRVSRGSRVEIGEQFFVVS